MENDTVMGLIMTDHFISVDQTAAAFLLGSSLNGSVRFLFLTGRHELVIEPITDAACFPEGKNSDRIYLLDHDGRPHLQEAVIFTDQLRQLLKLEPGLQHFFPGRLIRPMTEPQKPVIHFDLNDVISGPLPSVNEHEDREVSAHRIAQQQTHHWSEF